MSHDRGCFKCFRDPGDYDLCTLDDCVKKSHKTDERITVKKTKYVMKSYELDGYVIVPPLSPWDEKNAQFIIPEMSYGSLGKTATEAWMKHCNVSVEDINFSTKVQKWHDRGYRLKKAKLTIDMGDE